MIRQPSSTMIVGPSGSGKTQLTEGRVFEGGQTRPCHYCYAVWQPCFERMKGRGIRFHEGIPDVDHLRHWFGKSQGAGRSHGRRRERQTGVGSIHSRIASSKHYGLVFVKTCFHPENTPRPSLGMPITSSSSRTQETNRDFGPSRYKPFPTDGVTSFVSSKSVRNDRTGI